MDRKEKIELEIDKVLNRFEYKKTLPPDPYFYTRVKQQINEQQAQRSSLPAFLKPAILFTVFAINIGSFIWYFNQSEAQSSIDSKQQLLEIISGDLNVGRDQSNSFLTE